MNLCIANVLDAELLAATRAAFAAGLFVDGRTTAGWAAKTVKQNLRLDPKQGENAKLISRIMTALANNGLFRAAALPKSVSSMMLNRYETGMSYGAHMDGAIMAGAAPIRTDISFTIFISPRDSYEGGELVVVSPGGEQSFKLDAGAAVVYPANTLHRVNPVASGVRDVAVGWAQSLVRDPAQREILFDLGVARQALFQSQGKTVTFDQVSKSYNNLLRLWAEI